ncbi:uncharacterized protein LOC124636372 [Helicoverpa zea]|uniref:uncharacterized protein LOC124636372 n=1 Tax=Helicoverpa zea TaxID=7113 RepID=UPI001F565127|nr:uncharacterized protein LOC124636372 [Helicoverpa zea]
MPRLKRTPPATPASTANSLVQSMSDSDIPQATTSSPYEKANSTSRYKRPRQSSSPVNELLDFKQEMLDMLNSWRAEEQANFLKFSQEQRSSFAKLSSEVAELKAQNLAIQKANTEIEKSINFINNQYDDMMKQINLLQKEKQIYRDCLQTLEMKVEDLQQLSRPSCIEIRNIPLKDNEHAKDLSEIVAHVSAAVNLPLKASDIRDVYRLPGKPGTLRPVVAEFTSVETKNLLLSSVRSYNNKQPKESRLSTANIGVLGDHRPLYVSEYLPASSRKLFFAAREFAKLNEYKYCWTVNGNILLRKKEGVRPIRVKSEQTLHDLAQTNQ